jgi:hypothetical protein
LEGPDGIAVSGSDLFEVNYLGSTVGEYTTSGGMLNAALISGLDGSEDIAVVVPEPTILSLLALGSLALLARRRRSAR